MSCTLTWSTPFEVPHACRRPAGHEGIHSCECGEGLWPHEVEPDDPQHRHTCDWNLYPEQRPDPDLCNLGCLDDPEGVAASRAMVAAVEPQDDGSESAD